MPRSKRHWLGQHFLKSPVVIDAIVEATRERAQADGIQNLLEIGPGQGAITRPLWITLPPPVYHWTFVERDDALADALCQWISPKQLQRGDFLECAPAQWLPPTPHRLGVVSNLPYSAATAIVLKLCEYPSRIAFMNLMFQREVALRIQAGPNSPDRGSLSLWIQNEWDVRNVVEAPPNAFSPPPKVFSDVIQLTPRTAARVEGSTESVESRQAWQTLLRHAFSQRRQMLRRIFKQAPFEHLLKQTGIDGTRRAQSLDWPEWNALFRSFRRASLALAVIWAGLSMSIGTPARANVRETFGFGSGLSTVQTPGPAGGWAAENNPALLATRSEGVQISYGILWIKPMIQTIQNVVTSNAVVADTSPSSVGSVDTDYASTFGQFIGLTWTHWKTENQQLSFGLTTYAPFLQTGYVDTGEAYLPEFVLLRARTQRPEVSLGAGFRWGPSIRLGAGLRMGFSVASRATAFIKSQSGSNASSMRLSSSVAPFWVPFAGVSANVGSLETGLVARAPSISNLSFTLSSSAQVIGDLTGLALSLSGASSLLYDPPSIEWGASLPLSETWVARAQVDFQFWRAFRPPTVTVSNATTGGGVVVASSQAAAISLQNVISPKASVEFHFFPWITEWSYTYRPSIFSTGPIGNGNQLDPPRHRFFASIARPIGKVWLQAYVQAIWLVSQVVTKSGADEIGAPGYTAGGWLGGGGLSVQMGL